MKRLILIILITLFTCSIAFASSDTIHYKKTHDAVTIAASGSDTSDVIDFGTKAPAGFFSVQIALTGSGTGSIEYSLSNDGVNFLEPSSASDIATGITVSSGPGSDGKNMYSFTPMLSRFIKIKVTETGTSDSITVTVYLVYQ